MDTKMERNVWIAVAIMALALLSLFMASLDMGLGETVFLTLPLLAIIAVFFGFGWYVKEKFHEREAGIPSSDERTVALEGVVFKHAFITSVWAILAIAWYNIAMRYMDRSQLPADVSLVVALSAMIGLWLLFHARGHRAVA